MYKMPINKKAEAVKVYRKNLRAARARSAPPHPEMMK
jgi:hypothetical protein